MSTPLSRICIIYNIKNISSACRGVRKSAGKINGNPAKWMYYDEYTELNNSN